MPSASGASLTPARIGSSPSAPWKYRTNTNVSAKRDSPLRNAAPVAAAKPRSANSDRSSIGALARRSISDERRQQHDRGDQRDDRRTCRSSATMPPREIP